MKPKIYILTMHFIFPIVFAFTAFAQEPTPSQDEPTIQELHKAAIRYNEVSPSKILNWRKQAAIKALMPEVSVGYDKNTYRTISSSSNKGEITFAIGPDDLSYGWDFGLKWDLGDLIYNSAQTSIDSRSKLMVQFETMSFPS